MYRGQIVPWHKLVLKEWNNYPYKVLAIGRKGRKTTFDVNELFYDAMTDKRGLTYPYIAPTRTQGKEIVWDDHVAKLLLLCKQNGIPYKVNNTELSIKFPGYSKFTVDGSDNIESLRGKSDWGGVVLDEFSVWKKPQYAWDEVIEPNLLVHHAWVIISGTPKGYNSFHAMVKLGDHDGMIEGDAFNAEGKIIKPNKNFKSYRHTSYENPFIDHDWIDDKRERLTEAAFNEEYLARFEKYTGLIYKEFNREHHVIPPRDIPPSWTRFGAMDFGAENPTVHLWIAVDQDYNIYVYDEYYQARQSSPFHINVIKTKWGITPYEAIWGDPSAAQAILDYGNEGLYITPAVKVIPGDEPSWIRSGIDKTSQLLKISSKFGKPKLFIFNNCVNLIREFESYKWLEQKQEGINEKDIPFKANDHALDALRYFVISFCQGHIGDVLANWPDEGKYIGQ